LNLYRISYQPSIIIISIFIVIFSAYTALNLYLSAREMEGRKRHLWMFISASVLGFGIWSMHLTGRVALMVMHPESWIPIIISLLIAITGTSLAFLCLIRIQKPRLRIIISGLILGLSISGMHVGTMAFPVPIIIFSTIITVILSTFSMSVWEKPENGSGKTRYSEIISSILLGLAISVMFYISTITSVLYLVKDMNIKVQFHNHGRPDEELLTAIYVCTIVILGILLPFSKITQQKKFQALQLNEVKFKFLYENNLDPVIMFDPKGKVINANKKALDMSEKGDIPSLQELVDSFNMNGRARYYQDVLKGKTTEFTTPYVDETGREYFIHVKNIPILFEGKLEGVASILQDLTEQKKTERKLSEASTRLESFFNVTNEAINFTTADSKVIYANPAFEKMFGWSLQELLGKELPIHIEEKETEKQTLQEALENNEHITNFETRQRRKDGTIIDVAVTLSPIMDENGKLKEIFAISRDISERKHYESQLKHMAFYDSLTGVANRRLFYDQLKEVLRKAEKTHSQFAVFYLDCDKFKYVNDTYGHDTGDLLLRGVAQRVKGCIRIYDTLARIGGDEFAVIIDGFESPEQVAQIAERTLHSLQAPWRFNRKSFVTTSSIGISLYPEDGTTIETLLKNADRALYLSKEKGRNQFAFYKKV
jgi:diguanylate cyclase (GGDEF)-like protein/PAS domain S-box-containing protein